MIYIQLVYSYQHATRIGSHHKFVITLPCVHTRLPCVHTNLVWTVLTHYHLFASYHYILVHTKRPKLDISLVWNFGCLVWTFIKTVFRTVNAPTNNTNDQLKTSITRDCPETHCSHGMMQTCFWFGLIPKQPCFYSKIGMIQILNRLDYYQRSPLRVKQVLVQNLSWKKPNTLQTVRTKFAAEWQCGPPGTGFRFPHGCECHLCSASCCDVMLPV